MRTYESIVLVGILFLGTFFVFAQEITFPVPELGNCASEEECRAYCDEPSHRLECVDFAEANGYMTAEEAAKTRSYIESAPEEVYEAGPGGCDSEESCQAYCKDPAHVEECVDYGLRHGFVTEEEASDIREQVRAGRTFEEDFTGPGGCKGKEACHAYCDIEAHFDECISFAASEGFMSPEEVELARKFHDKTGPGGCQGIACETYCDDPAHGDECLDFAIREGFIPPDEAERARKFLKVAETGGPGGCIGVECRDYCEDILHRDECFDFAKANDLISEEELQDFEIGRKLEAKMKESGGPGGCADETSCMQYCQDTAHFEECLGFATAHGGMDKEEAKKMLREFTSGERHYGPGGPDDFGPSEIERFHRFEDFEKLEREFRGGQDGPGDFPGGPGGFPGGGANFPGGQGFAGPGGCQTPQECMRYCLEHREECGFLGPGPGDGGFSEPGGFPAPGEFPPRDDFPGHGDFPAPGEFPTPGEFPGGLGEFPPPEGFPEPQQQPHPEGFGICPAMPTVDSCPSGQKKVVIFESQECGVYYGCEPELLEGFIPESFPVPENFIPQESIPPQEFIPMEHKDYSQPPSGASLLDALTNILFSPLRLFLNLVK